MSASTELTYTKIGDYYFPDIALPENNRPFGKWGMMYLDYLKEHHPGRYAHLIFSGDVCSIVPEINDQASKGVASVRNGAVMSADDVDAL